MLVFGQLRLSIHNAVFAGYTLGFKLGKVGFYLTDDTATEYDLSDAFFTLTVTNGTSSYYPFAVLVTTDESDNVIFGESGTATITQNKVLSYAEIYVPKADASKYGITADNVGTEPETELNIYNVFQASGSTDAVLANTAYAKSVVITEEGDMYKVVVTPLNETVGTAAAVGTVYFFQGETELEHGATFTGSTANALFTLTVEEAADGE